MIPIAYWVHLNTERPSLDPLFYISLASPATSQHAHLLSLPAFFLANRILSLIYSFLVPDLLSKPEMNIPYLWRKSSPKQLYSTLTRSFFVQLMVYDFAFTGNTYIAWLLLLLWGPQHIVWYTVPSRYSNECLLTWIFFFKKNLLGASEHCLWTMRKFVLLLIINY